MGLGTFDGLLGEEVVLCSLDFLVELGDLVNDDGKILEDKTARGIGELSTELSDVMAKRTANIYEKSCILTLVKAVEKPLLNREEAGVHPRRSTLSVATHVKMEHLAIRRVGVQVLEKGLFCAVSVLEGRVADVCGILPSVVVGVLVELAKSVEACTRTRACEWHVWS